MRFLTALAAVLLTTTACFAVDPVASAWATGKEVVVQVGADWCQPCKDADALYGEQLRRRGVFVHVDLDKDAQLCQRYRFYAPIPKVIVYPPYRPWVPGPRYPHVYVGLPQIRVFVEGGRK